MFVMPGPSNPIFTLYPRFPSLLKEPKVVIRGSSYGAANNSTIPDPREVAAIVGVQPCNMMAPKQVWALAWRLHGRMLPLLHFRDKAKPRDSSYSLKVLWCKAIASMDSRSLVYDDRWTYDTLPSSSRWLLRVLPKRLFPRLHHANIEIRTAYLNKIIQQEIERVPPNTTIRLISLGAGYDIRCSRLLSQYHKSDKTLEAYELDLDNVVQSKQLILDRVKRRRSQSLHPTLIGIDLNDVDGQVTDILKDIMGVQQQQNNNAYTIFVSEGVMIYLNKGVPTLLLNLFREVTKESGGQASLCFADRLDNIPGGDLNAAQVELPKAGWELIDWCPKPGLARHQGLARLTNDDGGQ
jgi:O-methyltransferase involved in polyketide biosynthesis